MDSDRNGSGAAFPTCEWRDIRGESSIIPLVQAREQFASYKKFPYGKTYNTTAAGLLGLVIPFGLIVAGVGLIWRSPSDNYTNGRKVAAQNGTMASQVGGGSRRGCRRDGGRWRSYCCYTTAEGCGDWATATGVSPPTQPAWPRVGNGVAADAAGNYGHQ